MKESLIRIGSLCEKALTVSPEETVRQVIDLFDNNKLVNAVVVKKKDAIEGLVMNIHLNNKLSQKYGFSLFYNKPVKQIMDKTPMITDVAETIDEVAEKAMNRQDSIC